MEANAPQTLLLDVIVNGRSLGLIGEFTRQVGTDGKTRLHSAPGELRELGFLPPATADGVPVDMSHFPGVHWELDMAHQQLRLTASFAVLAPTLIARLAPEGRGAPAQSGTGATLNYSVVDTYAAGHNIVGGLLDGRIFSPYGVLASGLLTNYGAGQNQTTRLDTTYTWSDPTNLWRARVGDIINGGLAWTRPVRLAGVQFARDFSLRPDLVTFPVPSFAGAVAVPSTVDVLVNGISQASRAVPPGPFQVQQLPVVNGAGSVSVVVTDALGVQSTRTLPFYASNRLLAPGLDSYSLEAGSIRLGYGAVSNDYGDAVASASWRHGLTQDLTLEGHAEATSGLVMAGAGMAIDVGRLGVVSLSAAGSTAGGRGGWQAGIGFERVAQVFSVSASTLLTSPDFADVAAALGQPVPRNQTRASIGLSLGGFGALGAAFDWIESGTGRIPAQLAQLAPISGGGFGVGTTFSPFLPVQQHVKLLTLSYTRSLFGRAYLFLTGYNDFAQVHSAGVMLGISVPFGARESVSVSASAAYQQDYASAQYSRNVSQIGEVGGQVIAGVGRQARQYGELDYKSPWGLATTSAERSFGQEAYRASMQGAVSTADGGVFPSNTIYDSFAVVDTNGVAGVHVLQENRDVGTTDSHGRLLVTDLRSYDDNRIGIDPRDIGADQSIGAPTQTIRPRDRSGVVVDFPIHATNGALLRLVDEAGKALPPGGTARVNAGPVLPTGYDGEIYATDLRDQNEITVSQPGGARCAAQFRFHPVAGVLATIGPLTCRAQAPQ